MTNLETAKFFSNGEFEKTYDLIADHAEWIVVGENTFIGKQEIINNCEQVGSYFKSVKTDFRTLNIISNGSMVVINGTAEFFRDNTSVSFIFACDIYEFNGKNQIHKITSYCIKN